MRTSYCIPALLFVAMSFPRPLIAQEVQPPTLAEILNASVLFDPLGSEGYQRLDTLLIGSPTYLRATVVSMVLHASRSRTGGEMQGAALAGFVQQMLRIVQEEDLSTDIRDLHSLVVAFEGGLSSALQPSPPEDIDRLRALYADRIEPQNRDKYQSGYEAMDSLLRRWNPYGRRLSQLEQIIGDSSILDEGDKENGEVYYNFDSGLSGMRFDITVREGIIVRVRVISVD